MRFLIQIIKEIVITVVALFAVGLIAYGAGVLSKGSL